MKSASALLVLVIQHTFIHKIDFDTGQPEHFFRFGPGMVPVLADHSHNATVDDQHGAGSAGGHPAVKRTAVERNAPAGGLADGILLGVHSAHAMLRDRAVIVHDFFHEVPDIIAMRQTLRGADIAGYQHLLFTNYYAAAPTTVAGGSFRRRMGQLEKVFIPGGTRVF
jgi:hypothetical protein